ncbi:MAG TPA: hypothetical protein DCF73_11490 [Rhodobiaceae bacterium]|nr:hypothetical protein [Rhodobiaceae bacterium]
MTPGIDRWKGSMRTQRDYKSPSARHVVIGVIAYGLLALASRANAAPETFLADPANPALLCEDAAIHHERQNDLPRALLAAVAMAESGRYDAKTRKTRAWPWTINAEGRAYYFKTKADAVAKTRALLASGMRSIDIGCMQVNLRYHPKAFASLEDGFDPMTNVAYAADFLMRLHEQTRSWPEAVADYHSQTESKGDRYFARVIRIWQNERERVVSRSLAALQPRVDVTGILKPSVGHATAVVSVTNTDAPAIAYRPAPKVLDPVPGQNVRETASAAVGLRLSIAEGDAPTEVAMKAERPEPRVLEPVQATAGPTLVAEASLPGA